MGEQNFIEALKKRLKQPLPGLEAQRQMSSRPPSGNFEIRPDHRKSGVLALLYPYHEILHLAFMKRTEDGRVHSGQISFPGGKMETDDRDYIHTALREANEELGIISEQVEVLGQLSPLYIPPSNFLVYPSVGFSRQRPDFQLSEKEVAAVIETPLEYLLKKETVQSVQVTVGHQLRMNVPAFTFGSHIIWGATAMMLNELLTVVRELGSK